MISQNAKCDKCGKPIGHHSVGGYILYYDGDNAVMSKDYIPRVIVKQHCNHCGPVQGYGRLYTENKSHRLVPANPTAYNFEVKHAGQPYALYSKPEDVPFWNNEVRR